MGSVTVHEMDTTEIIQNFNSHAPWGSVTLKETVLFEQLKISTHTLRGERDAKELGINANTDNFNSHAPWGA